MQPVRFGQIFVIQGSNPKLVRMEGILKGWQMASRRLNDRPVCTDLLSDGDRYRMMIYTDYLHDAPSSKPSEDRRDNARSLRSDILARLPEDSKLTAALDSMGAVSEESFAGEAPEVRELLSRFNAVKKNRFSTHIIDCDALSKVKPRRIIDGGG